MYYLYDNIKIYYEKYINYKENILILPGWGNTRPTFTHIINYLKNYYNVYIIDYPSFGNSPIPSKDLTILDYALLIEHFITYLNIKNPIIIAHSFGGRIATLLSYRNNIKIKKMIFMDTAGIKRKSIILYFKTKVYKFIKFIITKVFKNTKERKLKKIKKIFSSDDYNNLNAKMYNTFKNIINTDLRKYFKHIKEEVLILWGKKDTSTPIKDAYFLKKNIKNSELIVFDKGTHFIYLEYPYQINLIIKSFINEKES